MSLEAAGKNVTEVLAQKGDWPQYSPLYHLLPAFTQGRYTVWIMLIKFMKKCAYANRNQCSITLGQ